MKIFVDELPTWVGECLFFDDDDYEYWCKISNSPCILSSDKDCPFLVEAEVE